MEKAKFEQGQTKLEEKTWLASINSGQYFTSPTTSGCNIEEIYEILYKDLAFVLKFASLPQRKILKIIQNQFEILHLYQL